MKMDRTNEEILSKRIEVLDEAFNIHLEMYAEQRGCWKDPRIEKQELLEKAQENLNNGVSAFDYLD